MLPRQGGTRETRTNGQSEVLADLVVGGLRRAGPVVQLGQPGAHAGGALKLSDCRKLMSAFICAWSTSIAVCMEAGHAMKWSWKS